ncbi:MAG TPA: hypothetical protein VGL76_08985 [Gaiellaceae bacterium]
MSWTKRAAAISAGCACLLTCAGPVEADVVALVAHFSTPPPKSFLIDVSAGSVGGLRLEAPASTYVRRLGIPDYIGALEAKSKVEMLWSRTTNPKTGWATATLKSPSSTAVTQLRFAGMFRTLQGDRRGTSLSTFLRHWRLQGPVVTGVVNDGVLVEYNVVVGGVVFAFDQKRILEAVGLAPAATERSLCVIPAACVVTRIR